MTAQLSHEETMRLITRAQSGDAESAELLVASNLALVKSIVKKYLGRGADYDDLYQLGCMGLVKAIQHFDMRYDVRFSTYAVPMIAGEIKRFLRDDGLVKVSRQLKELASRAAAVREELFEELRRDAGVCEIAARLNADPADVAMALDSGRPAVSLSEQAFDDDSAARRIDFVEDGVNEEMFVDRLLVKELLGTLDARERQIIVMRYFRDKTQSEVAAMIGVSQVQVSRLEGRILKKLRAAAGQDKMSESAAP